MTVAVPLVVGIGNPLRGDDGVGATVARLLEGDLRLAGGRVVVQHQLTPELAADVAGASVVVVIDASVDGRPGSIRTGAVAPGGRWSGSHGLEPAGLVALAGIICGAVPPVFTVAVSAAGFSDRRLSRPVEAAVSDAAEAVLRLIAAQECPGPPPTRCPADAAAG